MNSAVLHLASIAQTGTTVSVVASLPQQEVSQTPEASRPKQAQHRAESAEQPALTVNNAGASPNPRPGPGLSGAAGFHLAQMIGHSHWAAADRDGGEARNLASTWRAARQK